MCILYQERYYTSIINLEKNQRYLVSIKDENLLIPDYTSKFTSSREQGPAIIEYSKHTIKGLLADFTMKMDSEWIFKGKDQKKYQLEIMIESDETIIASLEEYGLKVRKSKGEILTTYLKKE